MHLGERINQFQLDNFTHLADSLNSCPRVPKVHPLLTLEPLPKATQRLPPRLTHPQSSPRALPGRGVAGWGQHRMPPLAEGSSNQALGQKRKVSLFGEGVFYLLCLSLLAEGSSWGRRMPLAAEILGNRREKKCPCRHMPHPSKELSFKAASQGPAQRHKGGSQGRQPGREAVPCTSSPLRAEPPSLGWIGITRKAREHPCSWVLQVKKTRSWDQGSWERPGDPHAREKDPKRQPPWEPVVALPAAQVSFLRTQAVPARGGGTFSAVGRESVTVDG